MSDEQAQSKVAVGPAMVLDAATGKWVKPLGADLTAFLDWPLYFLDVSVLCNKTGCSSRWCQEGEGHIQRYRRMTVRDLLADIKAHAEDVSAPGSDAPAAGR